MLPRNLVSLSPSHLPVTYHLGVVSVIPCCQSQIHHWMSDSGIPFSLGYGKWENPQDPWQRRPRPAGSAYISHGGPHPHLWCCCGLTSGATKGMVRLRVLWDSLLLFLLQLLLWWPLLLLLLLSITPQTYPKSNILVLIERLSIQKVRYTNEKGRIFQKHSASQLHLENSSSRYLGFRFKWFWKLQFLFPAILVFNFSSQFQIACWVARPRTFPPPLPSVPRTHCRFLHDISQGRCCFCNMQ